MVANTTASKRRPWPYDAIIADQPVVLVPDDDGDLLGQKTRTLDQSAPTTFEYDSADPFKERTFQWTKLYSGFGQATAPSLPDVPRRYSYATKTDTSIDGYWMKGPKFESHVETLPGGAGEVRQFVTALYLGTLTVFAICQNGVWLRSTDGSGGWFAGLSATTTPPLGVGSEPIQAVRFKGRGAGSVDALYIGVSVGNLWKFDGVAFTQAAVAAGPTVGPNIHNLERVGDELWAGGDYGIAKCEEDPFDRTKWSGGIFIGDQTAIITWLKQIDNTLYIFKTDGVYTVSAAGLDQELFPTLRGARAVKNGVNAAVWISELWIPFGGRTYRLDSSGTLVPDGLEQLLENRSDINGTLVAGAGHNTWFFYELYYSAVTASTYLIKHGSWVDDGSGRNVQFLPTAHHGAIYDWAKRGTSMEILPGLHPSGNDRLYVGFANGSLEWCVLPKTGPNPASDPNVEFTGLDSWVYLPTHHSSYQADTKLWRGASIFGPHVTSSEWCEVEYRIDLGNPSADWSPLVPGNQAFTVPGQRKDVPSSGPLYGRAIQFRVKLVKDPSLGASPANLTPVIDGLAVHEQIRPALSLEYTLHINASTYAVRRNGTVVRQRGASIREHLLRTVASSGTTSIMLPDGAAQEMTLVDYNEGWSPRKKRRDLEYVITVQAIQLATLSQAQAAVGITYATLEKYTVGQLEQVIS